MLQRLLMMTLATTSALTATDSLSDRVDQSIRIVPDFPKKGIQFKDIGPLIADGELFAQITDALADRYRSERLDGIMGLEARGFIFGASVAYKLGLPFIPVRKAGKLPGLVHQVSYKKEYGEDRFEIQQGILPRTSRVVIIDDILATGGTGEAACQLARQAGFDVHEFCCVVELPELGGRAQVSAPVHVLVEDKQMNQYEGRRIAAKAVGIEVNGKTLTRDLVTHPGAVVVLPVLEDGRIVMIKNYRFAVDQTLWELPAGTLEEGERAEDAALRELEEETGYSAGSLHHMVDCYASPGYCTEKFHIYQASGLKAREQQLEEGEQITVHLMQPDEVRTLLSEGKVQDAKTLVALHRFLGN